MLFLLSVKLAKPAGMSNQEFYGAWEKEYAGVSAARAAGLVKWVYKVAGLPQVVAVVEVGSADDMDHAINSLPIWKMGYSHIVTETTWTPLREYDAWGEDLKGLAKDG
jgi:muconolactone delta-isomerase